MASTSDRPLRSAYLAGIRRWCTRFAQRWCVPLDVLVAVILGSEVIPFPSDVQARAVRIRDIASLLDTFIPAKLQWNFWYRPSICNRVAPMCRLGWSNDCLEELQGELLALRDMLSEGAPRKTDQLSVLKLFKPAIMFRRLEHGYAVKHVILEHKPVRHEPLEFAPGDHAPFAIGPPLEAATSITS